MVTFRKWFPALALIAVLAFISASPGLAEPADKDDNFTVQEVPADLLQKLRAAEDTADKAMGRLADAKKALSRAEAELNAIRQTIASKFGCTDCYSGDITATVWTDCNPRKNVEIRGRYALITEHNPCAGYGSGTIWVPASTTMGGSTLNLMTDGALQYNVLRE